jgi:hypothetical protein
MEDRILFNPDNRLLGSSTGDLSLYGGQSDPAVVARQAPDASPSSVAQADALAPSSPNGSSTGLDFGHSPFASPLFEAAPETSFAGGLTHAFQPAAPVAAPAINATDTPGGAVPSATGSGSPLPAFPHVSALDQGAGDSHSTGLDALAGGDGSGGLPLTGAAGSLGAPLVEGVGDVVTGTVSPVLSAVESGVATVAGVAEAVVSPLVETVADTAAGVVDTVSDTAGAVLQPVAEVASDSVAALGDLAGATVAPVLDGVGDVAGDLGHVAAAALTPVADLADATGAAVSPLVESVGNALSATVAPVSDSLGDLAGSDPAAGVATLVSLVSVTDMFDLHPTDAPAVDAAGDPGLGVLDTLADDAGSLLGVDHGDHDAADHGGDDHHPFGL